MIYRGKIGVCKNKDLGFKKNLDGVHYVYIRQVNKDGTCDVNTFTQLTLHENPKLYDFKKMEEVKRGNTYVIPLKDCTLSQFSGVNHSVVHNVKLSKIKDIGKQKIKKRHHFFINKFMK